MVSNKSKSGRPCCYEPLATQPNPLSSRFVTKCFGFRSAVLHALVRNVNSPGGARKPVFQARHLPSRGGPDSRSWAPSSAGDFPPAVAPRAAVSAPPDRTDAAWSAVEPLDPDLHRSGVRARG